MRLSLHDSPSSSHLSDSNLEDAERTAIHCCLKARSAIVASALSGPVIHTILSTSLMSMLTALRAPLANALELNAFPSTRGSDGLAGLPNQLPPSRLLASMPQLLALANANPIPGILNFQVPGPLRLYQPPASRGRQNARFVAPFGPQNQAPYPHQNVNAVAVLAHGNRPDAVGPGFGPVHPNFRHPAPAPVAVHHHPQAGLFIPGPPNPVPGQAGVPRMPLFQPREDEAHAVPPHAVHPPAAGPAVQLKQIVLSAGGVGLTDSPHGSLMRYYCSIKLRIALDLGPSTEILVRFLVAFN